MKQYRLLSLKEVEAVCGLGRRQARDLMELVGIVQINRRLYSREADVERFLATSAGVIGTVQPGVVPQRRVARTGLRRTGRQQQ